MNAIHEKVSFSTSFGCAIVLGVAGVMGFVSPAVANHGGQYDTGSRCEAVGNPANFRVAAAGYVYNPSTSATQRVICPIVVPVNTTEVDAKVWLRKRNAMATTCTLNSRSTSGKAGVSYPRTVSGSGNKVVSWNFVEHRFAMLTVRCDLQTARSTADTNALYGYWFTTYGDGF